VVTTSYPIRVQHWHKLEDKILAEPNRAGIVRKKKAEEPQESELPWRLTRVHARGEEDHWSLGEVLGLRPGCCEQYVHLGWA